MLADHTLPSVDPYSFTQDVPWVNHEWLSELIMGAAYRIGGSLGLVVLKTALLSGALVLMLSTLADAWPIASAAAIAILAWGLTPLAFTLRPQLWTLVGLCVLCRLLIRPATRWWLVALPLLFGIWVNLHGGWLVGAGLLVLWTAYHLCCSNTPRALIAGVALISALATLVNPYGWHMWLFLASTVRMSRAISEWQPISSYAFAATIPYMLAGVIAVVAVAARPRAPLDRVVMIACLGVGSLRVARLAPLWVAVTIILLSPTIVAWSGRVPRQWWTLHAPSAAAMRVTAIPILCVLIVSGLEVRRIGRCVPIEGDWVPDRVAGRALAASNLRGRIVTFFDWGEYAIWHLSPALRVSIDGRRETVYSDAVLDGHDAMNAGTPEGIAYFRRLDPEYVWLPSATVRLREWLGTHGYRIELQTEQSFVAVRADRPTLARDVSGSDERALNACFPGP
jgi:hypothetical protein